MTTGDTAGEMRTGRGGFTLIEMAIVLVVIGLVTAGILVGKSLIRQSQINSAMIDAQRYITAAINFRQKYGALPGNLANATSYWGAMGTCPPTPGMTSPGGTLTCNGSGNGVVGEAVVGTVETPAELFLFWQHLANAQLIQGGYNGIAGSAGYFDHVIGRNCPAGRLPGLGFGLVHVGVIPNPSASIFFGLGKNYGHTIYLGAYVANSSPSTPIMTTLEAQSFDSKYDDGAPGTGNVQTWSTTLTGSYCATTNNPSTAVYNTNTANANSSGIQCSLILITGF
jgi:prepilin-type N-terminal cleavage/methylation domain-containing protein